EVVVEEELSACMCVKKATDCVEEETSACMCVKKASECASLAMLARNLINVGLEFPVPSRSVILVFLSIRVRVQHSHYLKVS
ncbi:unnamed protein product, partial [Amoebophrya sp. A25]